MARMPKAQRPPSRETPAKPMTLQKGTLAGKSATRGFTMTELLVVIAIIAVLAVLSTMGASRLRQTAMKTRVSQQLRQVSVAVAMWAGEKNFGEPFYAANGTGDYPHESVPGLNPALAPGNPARLLYDYNHPTDGYLTDHTLFFSPLSRMEAPTPKRYRPDQASETRPWGSYAWFYPSQPSARFTARQSSAIGAWALGQVSNAASGKLLMAPDYSLAPPVYREIYLVLLLDGTVQEVAQSREGWERWRLTNPPTS